MVCFSDAIDSSTLSGGMSYVPVDSSGAAIPINQVFYDPISKCAFAKPNQVLNQQSRYLLVVTDAVQDAPKGQKIKESKDFKSCLQHQPDSYCASLSQAVTTATPRISGNLVVASLFTTMSATSWLEKARQYVDANEPPIVLPAGLVSVFSLANLKHLTWLPDSKGLPPQDIPLSALTNVETVAFGLFFSPNFLNFGGANPLSITDTPTKSAIQPVPVPGLLSLVPGLLSSAPGLSSLAPELSSLIGAGYAPVSFHVFLPPASKRPANGFPVVIYGHGLSDNQFGAPTYIASTLASQGFATLAIEITGNGYGPNGTVQLTDTSNNNFTVATPGRGIALSANPIGPTDGCVAPGAIAVRDCGRQTAVDLFAAVSVLRQTNGLGYLDPSRIYYVGQSFGTTYGTLFHAVEPAVSAAVLNSGGGTSVDVARLAFSGRPLADEYLTSASPNLTVIPELLNVANGSAPPEAYFRDIPGFDNFNDNYPLRDQGPLVNTVQEAPALQAAFEAADWLGMNGDPLAYGQHLKLSTLAGVPAKKTMFTFGLGDLEVPDPAESALVMAAGGLDNTWYFQFDRAVSTQPSLMGVGAPGFPLLPHRFLSNPTIFDLDKAAEQSIAIAAQQQVADFFKGGNTNPNSFLTGPFTGITLFQALTQYSQLPQTLNFLQFAP